MQIALRRKVTCKFYRPKSPIKKTEIISKCTYKNKYSLYFIVVNWKGERRNNKGKEREKNRKEKLF